MTDLLRFVGTCELTAAADGAKRPPRVSILAYSGGAMKPPGWPELVIDLAGAEVAGPIPLLAAHGEGLEAIAGQGLARIADGGISVDGILTDATKAGQTVLALARSGVQLQASVGYQPGNREHVRAGETIRVNNRTITAGPEGLTVLRRGRLREVSLVATGADPQTSVAISASLTKGTNMETATSTAQPQTTTDRLTAVQAAWQSATWHDPAGQPRQRAEQALIRAAGGLLTPEQFQSELAQQLLTDRELALAKREADRAGFAMQTARQRPPSELALQAAFSRTCGLTVDEKAYPADALEQADKLRTIGLQELLLRAAHAAGYHEAGFRISGQNLKAVLQAAFSTASVPGILSNVANKLLLTGFESVEGVWRQFSAIRPVKDFKTVTSYRLTDDMEFEQIGPTGEIAHGEIGEESYTNRAATYGKMFALTREAIINDDLGAFDAIKTRLGRGYGLKLNAVFWATFLDDAAFFTAPRGNLITAVLGEAGLAAGELALNSMTDAHGNPIDFGDVAHILLTGPTLHPTARKWFNSAEVRDTTANTKYGVTNAYQNTFKPAKSRYVTSTTAWYLLPAAAGDLSPMEVCFLGGNEGPTIETADADFSTLGVLFRGYGDFGCARKEWRAAVKSTGAG